MPKESKKFINPLLRPSSDAEPKQEASSRDATTMQTSAATSTSAQTSANEAIVQPAATHPAQTNSSVAPLTAPSGTSVPYQNSMQQGYASAPLQPVEASSGSHALYGGYAGHEMDPPPVSSVDAQQNTYTQAQTHTYAPSQPTPSAYPQQHLQSSNPATRETAYSYRTPDRSTSDHPPLPQTTTNKPPAVPYSVPPLSTSPLPQTYTPANMYTSPSMNSSQSPAASPQSGHETAELPAYYSTTAVPRRRRGAQSFEQTHERITLWIDKRLKQAFDELSYEHDLSKTSLLNEAVADLLRKYASR